VLAAAGLGIWWLRVRGRTGRRAARSAAPPVPDELDGRMRMLARARADGDATQFYDEAVAVVRIVLARRLGEPVAGKGTDDLVGLLEKTGWPEDATASLRLLLEKADRRRFAPSRPEAWELAQDEATVRGVLDLAARPADAPAAAEEGNVQ
jgi:hypothetical protein